MPIHTQRYARNPILKPENTHPWEAVGAFNGCPVTYDTGYKLLYRALSGPTDVNNIRMNISSIGIATSENGVDFVNREQFIKPEFEWEAFGCEDPRVSFIDGQYVITYTAISQYPFTPDGVTLAAAFTKDFITFEKKVPATFFNSKAMVIFPKRIRNKIWALLTVHTDKPPVDICYAELDSIEDIFSYDFWKNWYSKYRDSALPLKRMSRDYIEVGAPPVETQFGWLFLYSYIRNYQISDPHFTIEAVLLDKENPNYIIARTQTPLLVPEETYELNGVVPNVVFPTGALIEDSRLAIYYGAADTSCCVAYIELDDLWKNMNTRAVYVPKMKKFHHNPLMQPIVEHPWEAKAVFNPASFSFNNKIHILYRAVSDDDVSTIGYAVSSNGITLDERLPEPIYTPRIPEEMRKDLHGGSGCEDPRVTKLGDRLYMLYTAYDGVDIPRVAMTSIPLENFIHRDWKWDIPTIVSPPGIDDKDACVFPEKIKGKYVILHRIQGDIVIDYSDNLDFGEKRWLECHGYITGRKDYWDSVKIGIAGPPVRVDNEWLLFYHGIDSVDHHYRVGAMLLREDNPSEITARSNFPFLEPEYPYEKKGLVDNVVFPCGMVLMGGIIYVYYGGADKVICVATRELKEIMKYLKESNETKMLL